MPRVVIPPDAVDGQQIHLRDPGDVHHLAHVLRVRIGQGVQCLDGIGGVYEGIVSHLMRDEVTIRIEARHAEPPMRLEMTLAQALIKPERFEWVIQKATELGVRRVIPLLTTRTVGRVTHSAVESKQARWQRIAREAAKQCGRAHELSVERPCALAAWLPRLADYEYVAMPTLAVTGTPLRDDARRVAAARSAAVLIGPEGDFTAQEGEAAMRLGARPLSLGHVTLRSETAALVTIAILQHLAEAG